MSESCINMAVRADRQGLQNLYDRIERMRNLGPEFIDITWGAGGKNADLTSSLVQVCQETIGLECCMHLCCTESESGSASKRFS